MTTDFSPAQDPPIAHGNLVSVVWDNDPNPRQHEFDAIAVPEDEGGFSVFAICYPGIVSQGETVEEAKFNIAEAFLLMLETRREFGESLEYSQTSVVAEPSNAIKLRITVNG